MNNTDDLAYLTIAEAGRRFRSGALRPETLVEALLARIDALDGRVGAWVCVWGDRSAGRSANSRGGACLWTGSRHIARYPHRREST